MADNSADDSDCSHDYPEEFEMSNKEKINGIDENEYQLLIEVHEKNTVEKYIAQCTCCAKYYLEDMITNMDSDNVCLHCFFWLNYTLNRADFIATCKSRGFGIQDYIDKCYDEHDTQGCAKTSIGCFLCDAHIGIDFHPDNTAKNPAEAKDSDSQSAASYNSDAESTDSEKSRKSKKHPAIPLTKTTIEMANELCDSTDELNLTVVTDNVFFINI